MCAMRRTSRSAPPPERGEEAVYLVQDFLRTRHSFIDAVAADSAVDRSSAESASEARSAYTSLQAADRGAATEKRRGKKP